MELQLDIRKLTLQDDVGSFDCRERDLNEYIWYQAYDQQIDGASIVYLAFLKGDLAGFISLAMSLLEADMTQDEDRPEHTPYSYFPALMIGRLATDIQYQRLGIGSKLCEFALAKAISLSKEVGCQYLILNAKKSSIPFYKENGFKLGENQPAERREPFMYFRLPREREANQ